MKKHIHVMTLLGMTVVLGVSLNAQAAMTWSKIGQSFRQNYTKNPSTIHSPPTPGTSGPVQGQNFYLNQKYLFPRQLPTHPGPLNPVDPNAQHSFNPPVDLDPDLYKSLEEHAQAVKLPMKDVLHAWQSCHLPLGKLPSFDNDFLCFLLKTDAELKDAYLFAEVVNVRISLDYNLILSSPPFGEWVYKRIIGLVQSFAELKHHMVVKIRDPLISHSARFGIHLRAVQGVPDSTAAGSMLIFHNLALDQAQRLVLRPLAKAIKDRYKQDHLSYILETAGPHLVELILAAGVTQGESPEDYFAYIQWGDFPKDLNLLPETIYIAATVSSLEEMINRFSFRKP